MADEGKSEGEGRSANKHIKRWEDLAKLSGKVAGGAAGLATVAYTGEAFSGVLANAAVGTAVEKAGLSVIQRFLGPRQAERGAKTLLVTAGQMEQRVTAAVWDFDLESRNGGGPTLPSTGRFWRSGAFG